MFLNIDFFIDTLIYSFIPLGLWISMRIMKYPDLAIEQIFVMGGVAFALMTKHSFPVYAIFIMLLVLSILLGLINGFIRYKLHVNAIILSLIMSYCYYSLSLYSMGRPNVSLINYYDFYSSSILLSSILIFIIIAILFTHYGLKTNIGNKIIATGCNENLSYDLGIKTVIYGGIGLSIAYFIILTGGAIYSLKLRNADISYGNGYLLMSIFIILVTRILDKRVCFIRNATLIVVFTILYSSILQFIISLNFPTELTRGFYALMLLLLAICAPKNEVKLL